ncbi:MAG: C4-dicarboxylate transporter DcuC [Gemmataceae bacterium]|nr:C4-dicarboxylate transporter DcuC [Gemmataceae bacterium]MDW8266123.1 C4-dicarboxylate transporter DcuC [Gemmataceae bacterium]
METSWFPATASLAIIAAAIYAVVRQVDVRLALLVAALGLGVLAGEPMAVVQKFLATLSDEKFVVPICTAMGFAYVLRHTGCDQHLVQLLTRPIRRVRGLLVPGAVGIGFLVNIPIISQTSTAATIGAVLVPLLRTAGYSPATVGSALLLGSSLGGELLNPGAPELQTVSRAVGIPTAEVVARVLPLVLVQLAVATPVFWLLSRRREQQAAAGSESEVTPKTPAFRPNPLKAIVPLVPLLVLFLTSQPLSIVSIPRSWLVDVSQPEDASHFDSRLIGAAMLLGVGVASLTSPRHLSRTAQAFFEGAGYAFAHIIALIVTAACFGKAVELVGLATLVGAVIDDVPALLLPLAGLLPLAFAGLSGSGMAATQSLFGFFVGPAEHAGIDPAHVGAMVAVAAAAGRTLSPVAAVTLMAASLAECHPLALCRRVAGPLLVGLVAVLTWAMYLS